MSRQDPLGTSEEAPLGRLLARTDAVADDGTLDRVVRRHRGRRARMAAGTGATAVLLVAGLALGLTLTGSAGPRTRVAVGPTPHIETSPRLAFVRSVDVRTTKGMTSYAPTESTGGLVRLYVRREEGAIIRAYLDHRRIAVSFAVAGWVSPPASTPEQTAERTCQSREAVLFELSDNGFAGQLSIPVVAKAPAPVAFAGDALLGVRERAPVEVVFADTGAVPAVMSVRLPNAHIVRAVTRDGVAVVALPAPAAPDRSRIQVSVLERGASALHLALPASGALAESLASCRPRRR